MKRAFVTALFLSILPLGAQQATAATTIRVTEQREVTSASNTLLATAMEFRQDGTASSTHRIGSFSTRIEFRGLSFRQIVKMPLTAEDAAKGITRRYHAKLACQAHRIWDGPMAEWSEWRQDSYGFFPSTIVVEEVNGKLQASAKRIKDFSRGSQSSRSVNDTMTVSTR